MLLVISDLHLEEFRPLPDPLLERLFDMIESVCRRAADRKIPKITLILLGDILECLKNTRWLDGVRPWDTAQAAAVDATLVAVVSGIIGTNRNFFDRLKILLDEWPLQPLYIFGNHDAILRDSAAARTTLTDRVPRLEFFEGSIRTDEDHQVTMLHGHEWDPDNRAVHRNTPFGDGVVVEFITNLPRLVAANMRLETPHDPKIAFLLEVDNVRPQTPKAISQWIKSELKRTNNLTCKKAIDKAFEQSLAALQKLIKARAIQRGSFLAWQRHLLGVLGAIRATGALPERLDEFPIYAGKARQELSRGNQRFLVCGHTHLVEVEPMRLGKSEPAAPMYFNTGAWRRVYYRADDRRQAVHPFRRWDEACLVVFHSQEEQRKNSIGAYEVHRGLLGF